MNFEEFMEKYKSLRDLDEIKIVCEHPSHDPPGEVLSRTKRVIKINLLKHNKEKYICKICELKYDNPMTRKRERRQTDEKIEVFCPCPEHKGQVSRMIKKSAYYGDLQKKPYLQMCKGCAQRGKVISEEQKEAIRKALTGIERSEEFKQKLRDYMNNNPEAKAKAIENLSKNKQHYEDNNDNVT